ncbi:hypothetical protein [Rhizobium johnstonii]|uniref:hypothetical protein n=1 Tax=Rhizobium johnstonii TaxID=3019933 RepID=UPI003F96D85D
MTRFGLGMLASVILTMSPAHGTTLDTALDGLSKVSFGTESTLAIGDSIDVIDPNVARERCIEVKDGDIKKDTEGAVASHLSFSFVKDFKSFENTLNVSYSVEASGSAKLGKILGGGTTLTNFGAFESFLKEENSSALIIVEASANQGRELIQDFALRDKYQGLLTQKKYDEFRNLCGTHFIRGWTRKSSIRVIFKISNIDKQGKLVLENTMKATTKGNFDLEALSGETKVDLSSSLKDTLILASKLGRVSARVDATGGKGIPTITQILQAGDPTDPTFTGKLLSSLAEVAKDFDINNSAPDLFLVMRYPSIKSSDVKFDAENFDRLGKIYRALLVIDQRLSVYEDYKEKDPVLWAKYFRVSTEEIANARTGLIGAFDNCRNQGKCDYALPEVKGLILDDLFTMGILKATCIHSYNHDDVINGKKVEAFRYLSSIAITWESQVSFLDAIDFESTQVSAITPNLILKQIAFDPGQRMQIRTVDGTKDGDIFVDVARENIDPKEVQDEDGIKIDSLRKIRAKVAQSIFILTTQTNNGLQVEAVLGSPDMSDCPVYKPM